MGGKYPNNTFTAVIFDKNFDKFADIESFKGKKVTITGTVKLYKEKPEIVLYEIAQLKLKK